MAETDIFNPTNWTAAGLVFNPNPSYGFTRKMGANRQLARPRFGIFPSRDIMNGGHIFSLSWLNTDITTAERIIAFYHDFKDGYFTIIDQDWNQRQYVGRFMTEPENAHPANGKYTFQGITFEEMPQARMLSYPTAALYGHPLNVVDDYLNPRVSMMQGAWTIQVSPLASMFMPVPSLSTPSALEAFDALGTAGDWAATAYVGFGFQMMFRLAPTLGVINLLLDGNPVVTGLDLSNGTAAGLAGATLAVTAAVPVAELPAFVTVTMTGVPLDIHRIQVTAIGPSVAGGVSILFPQVTYIY
jgi:hypothetical protein